MRPYWEGYLKLARVSCPIALHAACSTAERIAFRQVNKATANRLPRLAAPRRVVNLMEALRRSVDEDKKQAAPGTEQQPPRRAKGRKCTRHGLSTP